MPHFGKGNSSANNPSEDHTNDKYSANKKSFSGCNYQFEYRERTTPLGFINDLQFFYHDMVRISLIPNLEYMLTYSIEPLLFIKLDSSWIELPNT